MRHKGGESVEAIYTTPGAVGVVTFHARVKRDGSLGLRSGTKVRGASYQGFVARGYEHLVAEDDTWEVECVEVVYGRSFVFLRPTRLVQSGNDYRASRRDSDQKRAEQRLYERSRWLLSRQLDVREEEISRMFSRSEILDFASSPDVQKDYLRLTGRKLDGTR